MKALAASQDDGVTVAVLAEGAGRRAEKDGDQEAAIAAYREAIAAGSTDAKVADRLSIWLVKQELYAEAEKVLVQALQEPPGAAGTRDWLEGRLWRCQRQSRLMVSDAVRNRVSGGKFLYMPLGTHIATVTWWVGTETTPPGRPLCALAACVPVTTARDVVDRLEGSSTIAAGGKFHRLTSLRS